MYNHDTNICILVGCDITQVEAEKIVITGLSIMAHNDEAPSIAISLTFQDTLRHLDAPKGTSVIRKNIWLLPFWYKFLPHLRFL